MKVHLKGSIYNKRFIKIIVFMNESKCGQLIMSELEASFFCDTLMHSKYKIPGDEYTSSGKWIIK
jgi:hypothetical protein